MGIIRTIVISAAIYGAYKFLTEEDTFGKSRLDSIKEQAPEWVEKAKSIKEELKSATLPEDI
jgi:uncharacterized membrane protein (DUF106 family)